MHRPTTIAAFLAAALACGHPARAQIKIAITGPLSGPNAAQGQQMRAGAEAAAAAINAAGGVNGQRLELVFADDVSDAREGVAIAKRVAGDGARFAVGPYSSNVALPASQAYADAGILDITPSASNPQLTERGLWNAFRICGRDDRQAVLAAAYMANRFAGKKIAVLHDKSGYGKMLADQARAALVRLSAKVAIYDGIDLGERNFKPLIDRMKAAGIEAIYWGGSQHTEGALLLKQMKEQGLAAPTVAGDGISSAEFPLVGGDAVIGTVITMPPDPRKLAAASAARGAMTEGQKDAEPLTLYTYAAVQALAAGAMAAKDNDPRKVAEALHRGIKVATVIGEIAFDAKGDVTRPDYALYTWQKGSDGKITPVEQ